MEEEPIPDLEDDNPWGLKDYENNVINLQDPNNYSNSKDGNTEGLSDIIDDSDLALLPYLEDTENIEVQRDLYEHYARLQGKPPQRGCSRPFEGEPEKALPTANDPIAPLEDYTMEPQDPYINNWDRYNEYSDTDDEFNPESLTTERMEEIMNSIFRNINRGQREPGPSRVSSTVPSPSGESSTIPESSAGPEYSNSSDISEASDSDSFSESSSELSFATMPLEALDTLVSMSSIYSF